MPVAVFRTRLIQRGLSRYLWRHPWQLALAVLGIALGVAVVAEQHEAGSSIGPTLKKVLVDQFSRIRDGDRFFYQNDPDVKMLAPDIENTRLVDIIKRNTGIENIQDDLFIARDGDPFDDPCRS